MLKPAVWMSRAGIVVSPMNDASLRVPIVFTKEHHLVSESQIRYSRGEVDVMRDEQCLTGLKFQDEPLMSTSLVVVSKNSLDHALAFHLKATGSLFESAAENSVAIKVGSVSGIRARRAAEKTSREYR